MNTMLQDLRHGMRMLVKSPGFTIIAVLTLALGIGANTAIFSVVNALFLHPPGVAHPEQVVVERARYAKLGLNNIVVSAPDFAQVRDSKQFFASAALETPATFNYTAGAYPQQLQGAQVSWQWFDVFGAKPVVGRVFTPEEDQPNADHEVVLAYGAWQRWFGGDAGAIGRTIQLNQQPYRIIGVMRRDFHWPNPQIDLWAPLGLAPDAFSPANTFNESYLAVARLQPGVSFSQASAYMNILSHRVIDDPRSSYAKDSQWSMFLMPLADFVFGDLRAPILILVGAVAFVLLIACANIAGLLLAKAAGRSKELAVRAALGASRGRLIAQTLGENTVLGLLGILAGLLVAQAGTSALLFAAPQDLATGLTFPLDKYVLLFTAVVGVVAVLIFGIAPAWHMSRTDPYNAMRESGRSATGSRGRQQFRSLLVAGELALGLILLAGTGLLLKSLARIGEVNPGFQPHGVMTAVLTLPQQQYNNNDKQYAFFHAVLGRLSHTAGVKDAGAGFPIPFAGGNPSASFGIEGRPAPPGDPGPHGNVRFVTPEYFTAFGIPLIRGRYFTDDDREGSQAVAVIDDNLAREYWPNQDPIGKRIRNGSKSPWATIVGIAGHIRFNQLAGEESSSGASESGSKGVYYFPLYQSGAPFGFLIAKSNGSAASAESAIREAVRATDPNLPVSDMSSMDARIAESLGPQRFAANLLAVFAALAILLAAVGLYGLISYSVAQRTNEIGIRMALGARRSDVLRLILLQGAKLAIAGTAAGVVAGLALMRAMQSVLYGVSAADPLSFIGAALLLTIVALIACYIPARRAMRVDPMVALRYE
ncbi:MAG TPA: ABC transporter permease [Candidatus Acidoferrales bacterium]|nr:ABC transporter permease [Candidatus Acidoferrales bacterium]